MRTDRPCASYFALKRLDHSLVSPVVSLPVQYVIRPFAPSMARRSIVFAFFVAALCPLLAPPPPPPPPPSSSLPPQPAAMTGTSAATTTAAARRVRRTTMGPPSRVLSARLPPSGSGVRAPHARPVPPAARPHRSRPRHPPAARGCPGPAGTADSGRSSGSCR